MTKSFFQNIKDYHVSSLWMPIYFALILLGSGVLLFTSFVYIAAPAVSVLFKLFVILNILCVGYNIYLFVSEYKNNKQALDAILEYMKQEPYSSFKMLRSGTWNDILSEEEKMYIMKKSYNTCKSFDDYIKKHLE